MASTYVDVQLRWGDLDAYGHVNNVSIVRILEEARARAFWTNGPLPPLEPNQKQWSLIASIEVRYLAPLDYSAEPITVEMSTRDVGAASFVIDYRILASDGRQRVAASSKVAVVDAASGRPVRLGADIKLALAAFGR